VVGKLRRYREMKTKEVIIGFVKKYKIESVAVLIFSVLAAIAFDINELKPKALFDAIIIFAFIAAGTFFVDKVFSVYGNEIRQKLANKIAGEIDGLNVIKIMLH